MKVNKIICVDATLDVNIMLFQEPKTIQTHSWKPQKTFFKVLECASERNAAENAGSDIFMNGRLTSDLCVSGSFSIRSRDEYRQLTPGSDRGTGQPPCFVCAADACISSLYLRRHYW